MFVNDAKLHQAIDELVMRARVYDFHVLHAADCAALSHLTSWVEVRVSNHKHLVGLFHLQP